MLPMLVLNHLPESSIKSFSPLQTAWTGFDPYLYSSGPSLASPTLVEIAAARSFILNIGICLYYYLVWIHIYTGVNTLSTRDLKTKRFSIR